MLAGLPPSYFCGALTLTIPFPRPVRLNLVSSLSNPEINDNPHSPLRFLFHQASYPILDRDHQLHLPCACQHHFAGSILPRRGLPQDSHVHNLECLH